MGSDMLTVLDISGLIAGHCVGKNMRDSHWLVLNDK